MRIVSANISNIKGKLDTNFKKCVGIGRAGEILRHHVVEQLKEAKIDCGFEYLRFHGMFAEDIGVYNEDENGSVFYNWQYLDLVFDTVLDLGYRPFVEFSFMPHQLAKGDKEIFWWHANVTMPNCMQKWGDLIENTVLHFTQRYGKEEVQQWYFEVWNEPNYLGFFAEDIHAYFKLYKETALAVKRIDESYIVGGPATAGNEWVSETIAYCVENEVPLDFISTHTYGVEGAFDATGDMKLYLMNDIDCIQKEVEKICNQIQESAMPNLDVYYTEWGTSYSPTDMIHDSYIEASYVLYHLKRIGSSVRAMAFWDLTDIIEEDGPSKDPFHGGFGLVTIQSVKKPGYHAYSLLNKLGSDEIICEDKNTYITRLNDDIQILFWEYDLPKQTSDNRTYFNQILEPEKKGTVSILLDGLHSGNYKVEEYKVGFKANDPLTEYLELRKTTPLTREEEAYLREKSQCKVSNIEAVTVDVDGKFTKIYEMNEYDCILLKLQKL